MGTSVEGKTAEKNSDTYHFVIWSMQAFVSTRFHVVPRKDMLAVFFGGHWAPIITAKRIQTDLADIIFVDGF